MLVERLRKRFFELFGASPKIFQAPGRINLIGEHTDYNDGFVMPAAIEFHTWVAIAPRSDQRVIVYSEEWDETAEFLLNDHEISRHHWVDYVRGVALQLQFAGLPIKGANLVIHSNVPVGAGLSSSAALEVATALAFMDAGEIRGSSLDRMAIAKLCQKAENENVGARCGIMDQFAAAYGRAGHALLLDCRSLAFELLPLPEEVSMVICNSMVKHSHAHGGYNRRRAECEQGVGYFAERLPGIRALRDVGVEQLAEYGSGLPEVIFRRCRHVITENERTRLAREALRSGKIERFGELMYQSHRSLRDDYEVSCPELDIMVEIASGLPGVYGARMTGGGFGGCTVNLVDKNTADRFVCEVERSYKQKTGIDPTIYLTRAADGAQAVA